MSRPLDKEIAAAERAVADAQRTLEILRKAQADVMTIAGLHVHPSSVNTRSEQMQIENRIAISKGRSEGSADPFLAAIRAKGFTLRSLAKRLKTQPSLLSMQRKGDRPIPRERADKVAELTGWPADPKHWPGGIS